MVDYSKWDSFSEAKSDDDNKTYECDECGVLLHTVKIKWNEMDNFKLITPTNEPIVETIDIMRLRNEFLQVVKHFKHFFDGEGQFVTFLPPSQDPDGLGTWNFNDKKGLEKMCTTLDIKWLDDGLCYELDDLGLILIAYVLMPKSDKNIWTHYGWVTPFVLLERFFDGPFGLYGVNVVSICPAG